MQQGNIMIAILPSLPGQYPDLVWELLFDLRDVEYFVEGFLAIIIVKNTVECT